MSKVFKCRGCSFEHAADFRGRCSNCFGYFDLIETIASSRNVDEDSEDGEESEEDDSDDIVDGEDVSFQDAINAIKNNPNKFAFMETGIRGLDRVLGGGIVPGSVTLLCGSPGMGKSTIAVQALQSLATNKRKGLYVAGEESVEQMAFRYQRLGNFPKHVRIVHSKNLEVILDKVDNLGSAIVVVDSIQCMSVDDNASTGSISAIVAAIEMLVDFAKASKVAFIVIGHVVKDGAIGGPKTLEHAVDVSLYLEGREEDSRRILHCYGKNRFYKTPMRHLFLMEDMGLVDHPRQIAEDKEEADAKERDTVEEPRAPEPQAVKPQALKPATPATPAKKARKVPPRPETSPKLSTSTDTPKPRFRGAGARTPILTLVPSDEASPDRGEASPKAKRSNKTFKPAAPILGGDPIHSWTAPDGTTAAAVLAVRCEAEGCRGSVDRACTSSSGVREAGFHDSRIANARKKLAERVEKPPEVEIVEPAPPAELLRAPPRLRSKPEPAKPSKALKPKKPAK